mgnify:CR=1 FL=1
MRTLPLFFIFLLGFAATPVQLIEDMLRMTMVDLPRIEIKGFVEGDSPFPVSLSYDPSRDEVLFTVGTEKNLLSGDRIIPWMRLFFHPKSASKPAERATAFLSYLATRGIATDKKMLTTTGHEGDLTFAIGRTRASETAPCLFLYRANRLPYRLVTTESDVLFEEYHQSVLPLIFPGRITIIEKEKTTVYRFVRDEYR